MHVPIMPIRRLGALLAAIAVVAAALFALSAQGVRAEENTGPPAVQSGSAKSNCLRILEAGYAPRDYVLVFGSWWYWPAWTGAEGARMSSIWGSVAECRQVPDPDDQANVADIDQPQPVRIVPAPDSGPRYSASTVTNPTGDVLVTSDSIPLNINRNWPP